MIVDLLVDWSLALAYLTRVFNDGHREDERLFFYLLLFLFACPLLLLFTCLLLVFNEPFRFGKADRNSSIKLFSLKLFYSPEGGNGFQKGNRVFVWINVLLELESCAKNQIDASSLLGHIVDSSLAGVRDFKVQRIRDPIGSLYQLNLTLPNILTPN